MDELEVQRTLGAAIRIRRQELGLSQEDLARRIADHGDAAFRQSDVSRLERGKVTLPRRERLEHIAAVLGLFLGDLLARSGWTGADSAFAAERSPNAALAEARLGRLPIVAESAGPGSHGRSEAFSPNLRRLIEQAHETRSRTRDVLSRCEVTRALYEQPRRRVTVDPRANGRTEITYSATDRSDGGDS